MALALPVLVVIGSLAQPQWTVWQHLASTVLSDYVLNSLLLALGVGAGTLVVGTTLAWCCHHYEFLGRRQLQWLLLLPLAMPAYIIAYCYTGVLDFAGPLQTALRAHFDWGYGDYWFPEIRSLGGAIFMLVLVLYPYVFMLAKTAFLQQSPSLMEASRVAGHSPFSHFCKVAVPMARPAILTGVALAMMEALADYGTVQYFGVNTFTTGIFRTWFGMGNAMAAAQLSALLCGFVLLLLYVERRSRRQQRYYHMGADRRGRRVKASGLTTCWLWLGCALPVGLGFVLPAALLTKWAWISAHQHWDARFLTLAWNSFYLAATAAVVTLIMALFFAYARRLSRSYWVHTPVTLAAMGYAIPGTVIAVGTMVPLTWFDKALDSLLQDWFGISTGLLLSGTLFALIFAYTVRFLAVALHQVEAGLGRIKPSMDQAGRTLGLSPTGVLTRIHLPLLTPGLLGALLLVFVDVLKELPATLILRPFNFDTLAIRAFEMASDERLVDAALPSLTILLVGVIPVILLSRAIEKAAAMETTHA